MNIQDMMKQAQQMQERLQKEMTSLTVDGKNVNDSPRSPWNTWPQ